MAVIRKPLSEKELKNVTVLKLRGLYLELAEDFKKLLDNKVIQCHYCGAWLSPNDFYTDSRYATGVFPICKNCLNKMSANSLGRKKGKETLDSFKKTLRLMDRPYKDDLYWRARKAAENSAQGKVYFPVFETYVTMLLLSEYSALGYDDSDVKKADDVMESQSTVPDDVKQRFGTGFTDEDYLFLQKEYEDWTSRYECSTKAHEELFQALAFNKLEKLKARREGKPTKDIEATFNSLLTAANLTPKQNKSDAFMESQTLGTLIQKWEETEPVPEIDDRLADVEQIAKTQDLLLAHACKTAGIKTGYSKNYEKFLKEYTVSPKQYDADEVDAGLFDALFGKED